MLLKLTSAPHARTQKIVPRGPNFFQESPPPFVSYMGWGGVWAKFCQGFPPMGQGGWNGSPSLRQNGRTKRFPLLPTVTIRPRSVTHAGWRGCLERGSEILLKCGTIAYRTAYMRGLFSISQTPQTYALSQVTIHTGSDPMRVERVAGEGILHNVETWNDRRGWKTRADCSSSTRRLRPLISPRWRPVLVLSPRRWKGWLDRGSCMMLKRDTISADGRHARTVLRRSDALDLCPLPGAVAILQILQASPPHKCQEWERQGKWRWTIRQSQGRGHLGHRGCIREKTM